MLVLPKSANDSTDHEGWSSAPTLYSEHAAGGEDCPRNLDNGSDHDGPLRTEVQISSKQSAGVWNNLSETGQSTVSS